MHYIRLTYPLINKEKLPKISEENTFSFSPGINRATPILKSENPNHKIRLKTALTMEKITKRQDLGNYF